MGEELEVALERCLSCPCCLVAESHLPAAVPGGAAAVLAQVSPGQARGCLEDFGREGYPREETRAREETVVLPVFAHPPHAAGTWTLLEAGLHRTGRNQVRSAGQKG